MSNDWRVTSKGCIASRVIAMPMSIEDKLQLTFAQVLKCCPDFIGEWCEFIIDNQDSIFTDRNTDISARSFEHINVAVNFCGFDFNFGKIVLSSVNGSKCEQCNKREKEFHSVF